jgi:hypothetical protein
MDSLRKSSIGVPALIVCACCFVALGTRAAPFIPAKETNPQRPSPGPAIKTIVDLSEPQLRRLYPTQLGRIVFAKNQEELALLLSQAGEKVDAMFHFRPKARAGAGIGVDRPRHL